MKQLNWKNKKATIIFHEITTGPAHDLRDYLLKQKIKQLLFISHPLLYLEEGKRNVSYAILYKNGKEYRYTARHYSMPEYFCYIKDALYSFYWHIRYSGMSDVIIGVGNLNAFAALILKNIGLSRKVVYYVIDYVPSRFSQQVINAVYHWIERTCALHCDATWNLSPRMIVAREEKWKMKFPSQYVVPHGVHTARIKHVPFSKVHKYEILYMGTLLQKQGIQVVLQSLGKLHKKFSQLRLTIIGRGPYANNLHTLTKELHLENIVTFLGYIESHEEMENRIAQSALAVALYDKTYDTFSYYADPGKIKNYLGAGVPVLMTDVPYVASQVAKEKCGIIVDYDETSVTKVLSDFFSLPKKMEQYRKNAIRFARKYEWNDIFDKAFLKTYASK